MTLFPLAAGADDDDIEALAKSVGVLRRLCFVATCANGCGSPVPDGQVMCTCCAWS